MLIGSHQKISGKCLNIYSFGCCCFETGLYTTKYLGIQYLTSDTHVNFVLKRVIEENCMGLTA